MDVDELLNKIEQLRDIYCGRSTYLSDEEWIANIDTMMAEICDECGYDFQPMEIR